MSKSDGYQSLRADEVRVDDDLLFFGVPHRIVRIEPYVGTLFAPDEARIAYAADGWGITLVRPVRFRVSRPVAWRQAVIDP